MRALDVMTRDVITVGPNTSVSEIAALFLRRRISGVPVVDGEGKRAIRVAAENAPGARGVRDHLSLEPVHTGV